MGFIFLNRFVTNLACFVQIETSIFGPSRKPYFFDETSHLSKNPVEVNNQPETFLVSQPRIPRETKDWVQVDKSETINSVKNRADDAVLERGPSGVSASETVEIEESLLSYSQMMGQGYVAATDEDSSPVTSRILALHLPFMFVNLFMSGVDGQVQVQRPGSSRSGRTLLRRRTQTNLPCWTIRPLTKARS